MLPLVQEFHVEKYDIKENLFMKDRGCKSNIKNLCTKRDLDFSKYSAATLFLSVEILEKLISFRSEKITNHFLC